MIYATIIPGLIIAFGFIVMGALAVAATLAQLGNRRVIYSVATIDRVRADTIVSEHPVGRAVTVYFDPKNPRLCILDRRNARVYGAPMPLIGVGFAAIGIAYLNYVIGLARAA